MHTHTHLILMVMSKDHGPARLPISDCARRGANTHTTTLVLLSTTTSITTTTTTATTTTTSTTSTTTTTTTLCGRNSQVGSLAGAAHQLNDNAGVLR